MKAGLLASGAALGRLLVGRAAGGSLAWAAADVTAVVEEARRRLDFSPLATAACGRALAGAALLLRLTRKETDRLVLEIRGNGPLRLVIAEVDAEGNLRGMVGQPKVDLPLTPAGKMPVGPGTLLSADDRGHLLHEDGTTEAECVFCGEIYRFTAGELRPD